MMKSVLQVLKRKISTHAEIAPRASLHFRPISSLYFHVCMSPLLLWFSRKQLGSILEAICDAFGVPTMDQLWQLSERAKKKVMEVERRA